MTRCAAAACQAPGRGPRVAARDSRSEREADRMADQVLAGGPVAMARARGAPEALYRKCADCAQDDPDMLHRAAEGAGAGSAAQTAQASEAVASGGAPLPADLRQYFEPRFGARLDDVRLHTGSAEGRAAQGINARAYTRGRHIAFAPGAFHPETDAGLRLIAHELAHTRQNTPDTLSRQVDEDESDESEEAGVTPAPIEEIDPDTTHGGGTELRDEMHGPLTRADGRVRGQVRRRELAPGPGPQVVSDELASLEFDPDACEIVIPVTYGFRLVESHSQFCQGDRVDGTPDIEAIAAEYIRIVNSELSNQFKVRLSGCEDDCAGQDIAIRVEASRDQSNPDHMMNIVPREGRGAASTICMGNANFRSFVMHEAGHQVLERGEEYPPVASDIAEDGTTETHDRNRPERTRGGYNAMGRQRYYGRFTVFHARDFQHVLPFMRAVLPGCTPELVGIPQLTLEFRVQGHAGLGRVGGETAVRTGLTLGAGMPLTRDRAYLLLLELHADYLETLAFDERRFVLAGAWLGVERQFGSPTFGGRVFGGLGGGVSHEFSGDERADFGPRVPYDARTSGFGELNAGFGLYQNFDGGRSFLLDLQGSLGTEFGSDERAVGWFNVGLALGARF